jgi:PAS domain S-box-containing protein
MLIQEDYFKNIFNTVREGILILDENLRVLSANRSFYTIFKVNSEETVGCLLYDLGNGQWNIPYLRVLLEDVLPKNDTVDDYEIKHKFESIGHKTMLLNACKIREKKNDLPIILLAIEDITARKEIEAGLEKTRKELVIIKKTADEASEFAESVINTVREPLIALDQDLRVVTASRSFYEFFKVKPEETVGQLIYGLGNKQWDIPKLRELLETILPQKATFDNYEVEHNFATIGRRIMLLNARQIRRVLGKERIILLVIEDITERKRLEDLLAEENITDRRKLEDQLLQSQKMESIGTLAGGIAHDFNNILTAIIGYASVTQMKMPEDDPLRHNLEQILASSERAAVLTQSLLAFSRKQISNPEAVNLNELVRKAEKFLSRVIGEDIELKMTLSDNGLTVMADAGQLEQVLMNFATNAKDAMPKGGTLTIETGLEELDMDFLKIHEYGKPGMYAMLTVTDTGHGMDENTRQRIFEPFFTTKEVGKGTGLGLSMVYGIIKQHNGYINCYSEPGAGTTFKIYLPVIEKETEKAKKEEHITLSGGTETILLAEDEESVRRLMKEVLEEDGYKVIEAADGEEAVNKFMENKDRIDILLLDIIMPKMNGREAYERIKRIKPDIKLLMASGYPTDFISQKGIIEEGLNFIAKPMSPTKLLKKVRDTLDK